MSSVFKTPKVKTIVPEEVDPMILDRSELYYELVKKQQKKAGAVSQLLSHDNSYGLGTNSGKMTLGG